MRNKVKEWVLKKKLIFPGDRIICALSGGADSMAMIHCLLFLRKKLPFSLEACHLNHQIRGLHAKDDVLFLRDFCKKEGIVFHVAEADVVALAKKNGRSLEEEGRFCRYSFFEKIAGDDGKVATAHTASDQLETMIFHLCRGTGVRGFSGIPVQRAQIIRPMLIVSRLEIEAYLAKEKIPFRNDYTNGSDAFSRNQIRHKVTPLLREINPQTERHALFLGEDFRQLTQWVEDETAKWKRKILLKKGMISLSHFLQIPLPVQTALLHDLLVDADLEPTRIAIHSLLERIQKGFGRVRLSRKMEGLVSEDKLAILPVKRADFSLPFVSLTPGESVHFPGVEVYLELILPNSLENLKKIYGSPLKNALCCDRIEGEFILRGRQAGDQIRLPGRSGTKTLKKLFNEAKVPLEKRERLFILEANGKPVWVEEFGTAAGFQLKDCCHKGIIIHVKREGEQKESASGSTSRSFDGRRNSIPGF